MPRYGRDYGRSRSDEDRGMRGRDFGMSDRFGRGGMRSDGGRRMGGFNEDAMDEMSGFGTGGGSYDDDFDAGFRGSGYGGPGMGGYLAGGWRGRGYESREERDLGGYERGYGSGSWGSRGGYGGRGYGAYGGGREQGERGYESYGESRGWSGGVGRGAGMGGGYDAGRSDELRRLRAADIMTENPECVTPEVTLADAARKMRDLDVGIIPVVENEGNRRLRGVITDRDIAIRAVADGMDARSTRVSEVMTTGVETCNKNDPVQNVLRVMEREQVRRVPITDREGRLVGIIAQADVVTELDDHGAEHRVASTIERISEPTHGETRGGMRAGQGRGSGATAGRTSLGRSQGDLGSPEGREGGENL